MARRRPKNYDRAQWFALSRAARAGHGDAFAREFGKPIHNRIRRASSNDYCPDVLSKAAVKRRRKFNYRREALGLGPI